MNIIAISYEDLKDYGCPHCNCSNNHINIDEDYNYTLRLKCISCKKDFIILVNTEKSSMGFKLEGMETYYYPTVQDHPKPNKSSIFNYTRPDKRPSSGIGEYFKPRGVGYDLAGFVESKLAGERIIEMFKSIVGDDCDTYLDYREREPDWIQVKVKKEDNIDLEALDRLTEERDIITESMIRACMKPGKVPWKPTRLFSDYTEEELDMEEVENKIDSLIGKKGLVKLDTETFDFNKLKQDLKSLRKQVIKFAKERNIKVIDCLNILEIFDNFNKPTKGEK